MKKSYEMTECLTTKDAAKMLGYSQSTLRRWRCFGTGPKFVKLASGPSSIRYPKMELDSWLKKNISPLLSSTAEGKCA